MAIVAEIQQNTNPTILAYFIVYKMQHPTGIGFWIKKEGLHLLAVELPRYVPVRNPSMHLFLGPTGDGRPWNDRVLVTRAMSRLISP